MGIPGIKPPKYAKLGDAVGLITGRVLLFIHAAMERPAVYIISVATMGCILKYATNVPLKAPKSIHTMQLTKKATIIGAWSCAGFGSLPHRTRSIALPPIAITAPTDISCPPDAAVTSVIPIASIASSEPESSIVIRYPDNT